jgi:hypothetical protein
MPNRTLTRQHAVRVPLPALERDSRKAAEMRRGFKELQAILLAGRPGLCDPCVRLWTLLARTAPDTVTVARCAEQLGYRNRHQFSRWLGRHGYPPFLELLDWSRVLAWLLEVDRSATSLARQAWADGVDPSVCYRTVRRLTGANWTRIRELGLDFWAARFRTRFLATRCSKPLLL